MGKRLKYKIVSIIFLILAFIELIFVPYFGVKYLLSNPNSNLNLDLYIIVGCTVLITIPFGIAIFCYLKIIEIDLPKFRAERIKADIEQFKNQLFLLSPEGIKNSARFIGG